MINLPPTQRDLQCHPNESRHAYAAGVRYTRSTKTEFSILLWHIISNLRKSADVHQTTQQTFPEHYREDNVHRRDEIE